MKVFLVEDSALLRERLQAMLAAIPGLQAVGHAAEAWPAVNAILEAGAEAVVLDIQLAQGSGFEVLRALRERAPAVDVYVLTNFANEAYRRAAERLGAKGFFDKSTEFNSLRDTLAARASRATAREP